MSLLHFEARTYFGDDARPIELDAGGTLEDLHLVLAKMYGLRSAEWALTLSGYLYDLETSFGTYGRTSRPVERELRTLGLLRGMHIVHLDQPRRGERGREQFHVLEVLHEPRPIPESSSLVDENESRAIAARIDRLLSPGIRTHPRESSLTRKLMACAAKISSPAMAKAVATHARTCAGPDPYEALLADLLGGIEHLVPPRDLEVAQEIAEEITRLAPSKSWVTSEAWCDLAVSRARAGSARRAWKCAARADLGLHGNIALAAEVHAALGEASALERIRELRALPWSGTRWIQRARRTVGESLRRAGLIQEAVEFAWLVGRLPAEHDCACGSGSAPDRCCFRNVRA